MGGGTYFWRNATMVPVCGTTRYIGLAKTRTQHLWETITYNIYTERPESLCPSLKNKSWKAYKGLNKDIKKRKIKSQKQKNKTKKLGYTYFTKV